jgi:hypothetical protein
MRLNGLKIIVSGLFLTNILLAMSPDNAAWWAQKDAKMHAWHNDLDSILKNTYEVYGIHLAKETKKNRKSLLSLAKHFFTLNTMNTSNESKKDLIDTYEQQDQALFEEYPTLRQALESIAGLQ